MGETAYLKLSTKRDTYVLMGALRSWRVTGRGPASPRAILASVCIRSHCVEVGVALVKPLASEVPIFPSACAFCQIASTGTSADSRSMNTASSAWISCVKELNLRGVDKTSLLEAMWSNRPLTCNRKNVSQWTTYHYGRAHPAALHHCMGLFDSPWWKWLLIAKMES